MSIRMNSLCSLIFGWGMAGARISLPCFHDANVYVPPFDTGVLISICTHTHTTTTHISMNQCAFNTALLIPYSYVVLT
jgi:hypothetical protein